MRLSIVGNGAIGNLLALKLCQQQRYFTLLTRTGKRLQLQLTDMHGNTQVVSPQVRSLAQPGDISCLLLPLKAYQIVPAIEQLAAHIRQSTTIILLHNGMGTIEQVVQRFPANPIIAATTSYAAYKPTANHCIETGQGETHAGLVNMPVGTQQYDYQQLLNSLLPRCHWHQDVQQALWHKVAINAAINPLTALHQVNNGKLANPCYQRQLQQICTEVATVMTACGYATTTATLLEKVQTVIRLTSKNYSSMYQDVSHKRPTEIDYINGFVVKQGQQQGINVSMNQQLLERIKRLYE